VEILKQLPGKCWPSQVTGLLVARQQSGSLVSLVHDPRLCQIYGAGGAVLERIFEPANLEPVEQYKQTIENTED
jgi:hypothetical protein